MITVYGAKNSNGKTSFIQDVLRINDTFPSDIGSINTWTVKL